MARYKTALQIDELEALKAVLASGSSGREIQLEVETDVATLRIFPTQPIDRPEVVACYSIPFTKVEEQPTP